MQKKQKIDQQVFKIKKEEYQGELKEKLRKRTHSFRGTPEST